MVKCKNNFIRDRPIRATRNVNPSYTGDDYESCTVRRRRTAQTTVQGQRSRGRVLKVVKAPLKKLTMRRKESIYNFLQETLANPDRFQGKRGTPSQKRKLLEESVLRFMQKPRGAGAISEDDVKFWLQDSDFAGLLQEMNCGGTSATPVGPCSTSTGGETRAQLTIAERHDSLEPENVEHPEAMEIETTESSVGSNSEVSEGSQSSKTYAAVVKVGENSLRFEPVAVDVSVSKTVTGTEIGNKGRERPMLHSNVNAGPNIQAEENAVAYPLNVHDRPSMESKVNGCSVSRETGVIRQPSSMEAQRSMFSTLEKIEVPNASFTLEPDVNAQLTLESTLEPDVPLTLEPDVNGQSTVKPDVPLTTLEPDVNAAFTMEPDVNSSDSGSNRSSPTGMITPPENSSTSFQICMNEIFSICARLRESVKKMRDVLTMFPCSTSPLPVESTTPTSPMSTASEPELRSNSGSLDPDVREFIQAIYQDVESLRAHYDEMVRKNKYHHSVEVIRRMLTTWNNFLENPNNPVFDI